MRPRSAEPLGDLNSRDANFSVSARCALGGSDWIARGSRARARAGAECMVCRK